MDDWAGDEALKHCWWIRQRLQDLYLTSLCAAGAAGLMSRGDSWVTISRRGPLKIHLSTGEMGELLCAT